MPQDFGFAPIGQDDDFGFEEFGFEPISETKRSEPELRQELEKSFLSKAWGFLNTPPEFITSGANRLADWITDPNTYGRFKGLGGPGAAPGMAGMLGDRKSTRLNSSHVKISYAVFCLKKKKQRK